MNGYTYFNQNSDEIRCGDSYCKRHRPLESCCEVAACSSPAGHALPGQEGLPVLRGPWVRPDLPVIKALWAKPVLLVLKGLWARPVLQ